MKPGLRRPVACIVVALAAASIFGCSRYSDRVEIPAPLPTLTPFVRAFARDPTIAAWESVHRHMQPGALDARNQAGIVDGLTRGTAVPARLTDAAAVDLATYSWGGSLETIRRQNIAARRNARAGVVARTAHLAWLLLALRAGYVDERVDLSAMDLRDRSRFVGQSMNLANVDFSSSRFSAAAWNGSNLTRARFARATTDGALTCVACVWSRGGIPERRTLWHGRWTP